MVRTDILLAAGVVVAIVGVGALVILEQESQGTVYVDRITIMVSNLNKVMQKLEIENSNLMKGNTDVAQYRSILISLEDRAAQIQHRAISLLVPQNHKSIHLHLVQGIEYERLAIGSAQNGTTHLQAAFEHLGNSTTARNTTRIISAVFSNTPMSEILDLGEEIYSDSKLARDSFIEMQRYIKLAREEFDVLTPVIGVSEQT